jgi:hypothetical protein
MLYKVFGRYLFLSQKSYIWKMDKNMGEFEDKVDITRLKRKWQTINDDRT